jgi:hypothetical protein
MPPRTNAKKVKARAKAKAKAKAKVQAEADENKPTFDVDESVAAAVPEKGTSFDALPEELQLKILKLALFEDADEDVETKKNALRVERLKRPAVVPKRADEKPLYDDGYDPVPIGLRRGTRALLLSVTLSRVSKGLRALATDERLWAEPLALFEEIYPSEPSESPDGDSPSRSYSDPSSDSGPTFMRKIPDDIGWSSYSSFEKYCMIAQGTRDMIEDFFRGCARVSEDVAKNLAGIGVASTCDPTSLEPTDKPPPEDCYEEVFTRDVTTRLLFNEYGRDLRPGKRKEIIFRIILAEKRAGAIFAPTGVDAVAFDEASCDEYDVVEVKFLIAELVAQGYLRWKGRRRERSSEESKYLN